MEAAIVTGIVAIIVMVIGQIWNRKTVRDQMEHQLAQQEAQMSFQMDMRIREEKMSAASEFVASVSRIPTGYTTEERADRFQAAGVGYHKVQLYFSSDTTTAAYKILQYIREQSDDDLIFEPETAPQFYAAISVFNEKVRAELEIGSSVE